MKKTIPMAQPQSPESDSDETHNVGNQSIVVPAKLFSIADSFEKKEHSWFATSQIPTDLSIQVQGITFYVHKYPLISRCDYLGIIELQPKNSNSGYDLKFENFPGGSETFEIILKFCYGYPVNLNPNNVAALRCASEFLEMTEELEDGNLISKTEAFLTFVVLSTWRDSITVLKSCESLTPWAENLQIVRRCCESISWKVSQENSLTRETSDEESWWFDDVAKLRIDHFVRIITAVRAKGLKPETIGSCIVHYAGKWLPGMDVEKYECSKNETQWSITSSRRKEGGVGQNKEQRMIIESLVSILPLEKEAVSCKFLLWLLKMAIVYSVSPALVADLEKRAGMVLENASVNDLLIPSYMIGDQGKPMNSNEEHTMHNVDAVQRIFEYFQMQEERQQQPLQKSKKQSISKLLDNYLAEIARDPNLSVAKFQIHSSLSEHDRRRLCKVMDCEKLSLDACMHAAQNDRLPLRTVIQVLFSEQVKMRAAVQGKEQVASSDNSDQEGSWSSTKNEIKNLKSELEKVKEQMIELQRDYSELQQKYNKLNTKQRNLSGWTFGWKNIRNSALFHKKMEVNETGEGKERLNPIGCRVSFRRRRSIS
ncbi:hypothetical protein LguiB_016423 [Lonicera macranthoides]